MREKDSKSYRTLRSVFSLTVFAVYATLFYGIWLFLLNPMRTTPFENKGNYLVLVSYAMLVFSLLRFYGGFQFGETEMADLLASHGAALLVCNGLSFFLSFPVIGTWHYWMQMIFAFCCLEIGDCLVLAVIPGLHKMVCRVKPEKRTILVYRKEPETAEVDRMMQKMPYLKIIGRYSETEAMNELVSGRYSCAILLDLQEEMRNAILVECYKNQIEVFAPYTVSDTIVMGAGRSSFGDVLAFHVSSERQAFFDRIFKRIGDVVLSVVLLIALFPLMGVIALLVRIKDGEKVFFCQERCTMGGKRFQIYKFRSMRTDAGQINRVTRIGNVLRKTHLDELPQLINILKGDMSFVGPRPERPELVEQYCKALPEFSLRMDVKAGLTGYAQVYGSYGPSPEDKLRLDLYYINSRSLLMDIKLLLMTIKTVLRRDNGGNEPR